MRLFEASKRLGKLSGLAGVFLFLAGASCCQYTPVATVTEPAKWLLRASASDSMLQNDSETLLDLKVEAATNYDEFRFKVGPDATTACNNVTGYSAWIPKAQRLQADISGNPDGKMRLCVLARGRNECGQLFTQSLANASIYRWKKSSALPGAFTVTGPTGASNTLSQTVAWQASANAVKYDVKVARQPDCSDVAHSFNDVTTTSQAVTLATDGTYFSCVTAKNSNGGSVAASNNGLQFSVDSTPPSAFNLTDPNVMQTSLNVTAKWSAAAGASNYKLELHTANNCLEASKIWESTGTTTEMSATAPGDGTFFFCAWAKDAANNAVAATNNPFSFQVQQPVIPPVETVVRDSTASTCWATSPDPNIDHQYDDTFLDLYSHAAASFIGDGKKLKSVGALILHQSAQGIPNGGNLVGVDWTVLFFQSTGDFQSDPNLANQPANSANKRVTVGEPSNVGYATPVGVATFNGNLNFDVHYVEVDISSLNIQTTLGANHLIALIPRSGNNGGLFKTLFSKGCGVELGAGSDWYKLPPSANMPANSFTALGAPYSRATFKVVTTE